MASQIVTDEKGNTVKVVCEVYRKDMKHPFRYEALMKDFYNPKSQVWVKSPTAMLVKVAESHALKRAFKISGVVGDDFDTTEMLEEQKAVEHNATPHVVVQTAITPNHEQELATEQEVQELRKFVHEVT